MTAYFTCPRRYEAFQQTTGGVDQWRDDGTCSYCGSESPEAFFKFVESGGEVVPTDKSYKVYLGVSLKFYMQHFSDEDKHRFIDLYNKKEMKMGYPGYFYVKPFFVQVAHKEQEDDCGK